MIDLNRVNAIIREGYEAFYNGDLITDCPYSDSLDIVDGTSSLTPRKMREDWLLGWQLANTINGVDLTEL